MDELLHAFREATLSKKNAGNDLSILKAIAQQFKSPEKWTIETKIKLYELAINNNNLSALKLLSGKLNCDVKYFSNETKLNFYRIAIKKNYLEVIKFLHQKLKIDINVKDRDNSYTPIFYVAMHMKNEITPHQMSPSEFVINVEPADNNNGEIEMIEARKSTNVDIEVEIMRYLLKQGASYTHESTSTYNATVLHAAARQGNVKFLFVLHDWINNQIKDKSEALRQFLLIINTGKRSVVHQACRSGQKEFLKAIEGLIPEDKFNYLLSKPDSMTSDNCLHLACTKGNEKLIRKLLSYDVGPSLTEQHNQLYRYPLDNFIESLNKSDAEKAQALSLIELLCPKKLFNDDTSMLPRCIEICINNNYLKIFEKIVQRSAVNTRSRIDDIYGKLISNTNENKQNVLHFVSQYNHIDFLRYIEKNVLNNDENLLGLYKQSLVASDTFANRPMDYAFLYENEKMAKSLFKSVQQYAEMTIMVLENSIYSCVEKDLDELLRLLLSNQSLKDRILYFEVNREYTNNESIRKNTLMHLCAEYNSIKCFSFLASEFNHDQIFDCMMRKNSDDLLPINLAIQMNNIEILQKFLSFCEDNSYNSLKIIESADEDSNRSIHFAAETGNTTIMELILNQYPKTNSKNSQNKSYIDILCSKGHLKALKISMDYMKSNNFEIKLENAIKCAIENRHAEIVDFLLQNDDKDSITKLIKAQFKCEDGNIVYQDDQDDTADNLDRKKDSSVVIYDELSINILDLAIKSGDADIAKIIVDNADMDELEWLLVNLKIVKTKRVLTFWDLVEKMPEVAEMCFDKYLNLEEEKEKYELDFILLDRKYLLSKYPELKDKLPKEKTLNVMAEAESEPLLKHPLVTIYMNLRWDIFTKLFYYGGLLLYLSYVILLSVLIILNRPDKDEGEVNNEDLDKTKLEYFGLSIVVFSLAILLLIKETYQMATLRLLYFSLENVVDLTSFVSSVVMTVPFGTLTIVQRLQSGSVAVIFGYIALGFYSKRISKVGIYASAVMQVVRTILIFLLTMSVYIIGFSIAFYVLFDEDDYKWSWLIRIAFMMIGDFSFDDMIKEPESEYTVKFFVLVVFLIALPIVINNLLISFSISDTKEILENASLQTLKTEIGFLTIINEFTTISTKTFYLNDREGNLLLSNLQYLNTLFNVRSNVSILRNANYQDTVLHRWKLEREAKLKELNDDNEGDDTGALRNKFAELDSKFEMLKSEIIEMKTSIMQLINKL